MLGLVSLAFSFREELVSMSVILEGFPNYIIFFDNQHIQRYVTTFSVSKALGGNPGEAVINMLYTEAFMQIPYMTDVRIFVRNIFSSKYQLIFSGQLHGRQVSINGNDKQIIFTAYDHMFWLQRIPVPFLFGVEKSLDRIACFSWLAKGINFQKVQSIVTAKDQAFDNLNLEDTIKAMFAQVNESLTYHADATEADDNSIYHWLNLANKIKVVSDIDAALRKDSKLDIFYQGAIVENMYVLLAGIVNQLGYEMYEDLDEMIKIKEPYWSEGVVRNHVIDPVLMIDFNEDTNWDSKYTRVLVTGGVEASIAENVQSEEELHQFMPAGLYIGNTEDDFYVDALSVFDPALRADNSFVKDDASYISADASRNSVVGMACSRQGLPYVWGGTGTMSFDCSGLVVWSLKQVGYVPGCRTSEEMYKIARPVSLANIQPGDLGFSNWKSAGPGHVGMYCGQVTKPDGTTVYRWIQASSSRKSVVIDESPTNKNCGGFTKYGDIISTIQGGYSGAGAIAVPIGAMQKPLTKLTDAERKYGINVFETQQPLIRMNTTNTTDNYGEVVPMLKQYTKYLYNVLNSATVNASMTMLAAPWLRLGFNLWLDPNGMSRFYYINSIRHSGDANGVYTALGLTYGRSETEYTEMYNSNSSLGKTHTFTKDAKIKSEEYVTPGKYAIVTPDEFKGFKSYVSKIHDKYDNQGVIESYNSDYRDIYGEYYVRRNTTYLNRWDTEFNLIELHYMMKAYYSPKGTTVNLLANEPLIGQINPLKVSDRSVSEFARKVIEYDAANIDPPKVVTDRVKDLAAIMDTADIEIAMRYNQTNPNRDI